MRGRALLIGAALIAYLVIALQWRDKSYFQFMLVMGLVPGGVLLAATLGAWRAGLSEQRAVSVTLTVLCVALLPYLGVLLWLGIPSDG